MQLDARIATMDAQQLRKFAAELIEQTALQARAIAQHTDEISKQRNEISLQRVEIAQQRGEITQQRGELDRRQFKIDALTHEIATLKRWKFASQSEQLSGEQRLLFEETIDADLEAIALELAALAPKRVFEPQKQQPRRAPLPAHLPRTEIRHEPDSKTCGCGCALERIGEEVSEKLDYTPGVFTVERHVRGKWACVKCQTLTTAPMPAQVIDKGIPTAGLLAQVLVAKYADHQPLYRQEQIFGRAGLAISRTTLGEWVGVCGVRLAPLVEALRAELLGCAVLHGDETPVAMLKPGNGKTHRAYLWSWCSTQHNALQAVIYDFAETRGGRHAKDFLGNWRGTLVCDDYVGYKALFTAGVTEAGCMAHARRKFHDLYAANQSAIAQEALELFAALYAVESRVQGLAAEERLKIRQLQAAPIADALEQWLRLNRQKVPDGSATAKAIDYSLKRWAALVRYLADAALPIDNNWVENRIRPIAIGRANWLFAGSLRAGERAAAVMSLIQSARLNGLDPYAYLRDVLERLPTQLNRDIGELLPHRWSPRVITG